MTGHVLTLVCKGIMYNTYEWFHQQLKFVINKLGKNAAKLSSFETTTNSEACSPLGRPTVAVIKRWPANTGLNTCYGDFEEHRGWPAYRS